MDDPPFPLFTTFLKEHATQMDATGHGDNRTTQNTPPGKVLLTPTCPSEPERHHAGPILTFPWVPCPFPAPEHNVRWVTSPKTLCRAIPRIRIGIRLRPRRRPPTDQGRVRGEQNGYGPFLLRCAFYRFPPRFTQFLI